MMKLLTNKISNNLIEYYFKPYKRVYTDQKAAEVLSSNNSMRESSLISPSALSAITNQQNKKLFKTSF